MQSIKILKNLHTKKSVNNNQNLQQVATLHENLDLQSPLYFASLKVENIQTSQLISGINLNEWMNQSLWLGECKQQFISGNWMVGNLTVESAPPLISYEVNGLPAYEYVAYQRAMQDEDEFPTYEQLSERVRQLWLHQLKRPLILKYFEKSFELKSNKSILKAFSFDNGDNSFVLLNNDCSSDIYLWNSAKEMFKKIDSFRSGRLKNFVTLNSNNGTLEFLTLKQGAECKTPALNLWKLRNNSIIHQKHAAKYYNDILLNEQKELYALTHSMLEKISLTTLQSVEHWNLTALSIKDLQFIPLSTLQGELLLNSQYNFIKLSTNSSMHDSKTRVKNSIFALPSHNRKVQTYRIQAKSELNPSTGSTRKLTYADFKQLVERVLINLMHRLNEEINIIQLSIPETDLYDEHMIQDFLEIIENLQKQNIFPKEHFEFLNIDTLSIPSNPAQVLASKTVQEIWPVIVEIQQVHEHLKDNDTHNHPECIRLKNTLGDYIKDVLKMVYAAEKAEANSNHLMEMVIQRIRLFQLHLNHLNLEINADIEQDIEQNSDMLGAAKTKRLPHASPIMNYNTTLAKFMPLYENSSIWYFNKTMPNYNSSEFIKLLVGSLPSSSRVLYAVSFHQDHMVPGKPTDLNIYMDMYQQHLFQVIPAHKPHSLVTLRIAHETLLAFVENSNEVKVLIYRGVQGFVPFSNFQVNGSVQQLLISNLRDKNNNMQHFLIVVLKHRLEYHRLVILGN